MTDREEILSDVSGDAQAVIEVLRDPARFSESDREHCVAIVAALRARVEELKTRRRPPPAGAVR